jgi:hypothetical protein
MSMLPSGADAKDEPIEMQSFLDLAGASGLTYRFHRVERTDQLPAIAGNFAYVRGEGRSFSVVGCGTADTLLRAGDHWPEAIEAYQADGIFVRLNVSWKTRGREHEDIVLKLQPAMVIADELSYSGAVNGPGSAGA